MSELLQNTAILVEQFNENVKFDLDSKGIDNSGEASSSLRVETDISLNSVSSLGIFYLEFLDRGRPPGKFPPPEVMKKWALSKPVPINPYLIGRKIAREGTEIFKNPSKGIQLEEKRDILSRQIKENAPKWAKKDILAHINTVNNKLKNI